MLAVSRGLMSEPKLLLMDEPSVGLAPLIVKAIANTIRGLRYAGRTIMLVEQMAAVALSLADHAYALKNGKVSLKDTGRELAHDPEVKHAYLGG
ncbi:MAG: hypothetical protein EXR05_10655 [Acetobacteraceae bacterium]|nr:hypothetical protein [Acetobacteraceae bacterium]MSP29721.1 hypothetical protein [Acetobacteraceae bacterium]